MDSGRVLVNARTVSNNLIAALNESDSVACGYVLT